MSSKVWRHGVEYPSAEAALEAVRREIADLRRAFVIEEAPAIRPDSIEMWHPLTGKTATSKSQYYKDLRRAGYVINDKAPRAEEAQPRKLKTVSGHDIKTAIDQLEAGYRPPAIERAKELDG